MRTEQTTTSFNEEGSSWMSYVCVLLVSLLVACEGEPAAKPARKDLGHTQAAATVDLDESYVVMGRKSVLIQDHTRIHSGNVGVSYDRSRYPAAGNTCVRLRPSGPDYSGCYPGSWGVALQVQDHVEADSGNKLFGDTVRLGKHVAASEVYYAGSYAAGTNTDVGETIVVNNNYFPLFPALPTMPTAIPGRDDEGAQAPDVIVAKNAALCVEPGVYGSFRVKERGTLRFAADCDNPNATTQGTYTLRDIDANERALVRFGPGVVRMRDINAARNGEVRFDAAETHVRNLRADEQSRLVFAPGIHHSLNFRTRANAVVQFIEPESGRIELVVRNRFKLGERNAFNATAYGSSTAAGVDASRVLVYVHGHDEPDPSDDEPMPAALDETPRRPHAVRIQSHTKLHANIMAISAQPGGSSSIRIHPNSVAIGSYFADHIVISDHVELTNRNGLVGQGGADPLYLDGDADNDGKPDETDNCLTVSNVDQLDGDSDSFGDACDNCPSIPNPRQERAYPNDPGNNTGAACVVPPLGYCGDGVVQATNDEACDNGFANNGPSKPCSTYCESNLPRILTQPAALTVTEGNPASFTVGAAGQNLSYQWQRDGVDIPGATQSTYTLASATFSDDGSTFRCLVSNFTGTVSSLSALLTVRRAAPVITQQPSDQTVLEGQAAVFSVTASGSGLSYRWQKNGHDIANANGPTYELGAAALDDDGSVFRVVVSNTAGSVTSAPAKLHVHLAPPVITAQPESRTVLERAPAVFTVTAQGTSLSYQWQKGGVNIAGATTRTFELASAALDDAGEYRVIVSNTAGSVTSNIVTLIVQRAAPIIIAQPSNATVPEGSSASFSVVALGSGLHYQWQKNGVDIPGATAATLLLASVQLSDNGAVLRVIVSNDAGSVTSTGAVLRVASLAPVITVHPENVSVLEGDPVGFSVSASGNQLRYQWQKSGSDIPGATTATYTIASATLADHGAVFRCIVSNDAGSVSSLSATLSVNHRLPVFTAEPEGATVLEGESATFSAVVQGSNVHYQWQRDGADIVGATLPSYTTTAASFADDGATFRLRATNPAGSVLSDTATLRVNLRVPTILVQPAAQTVTEGQTASFSVHASGTALSYRWQRDGIDIPGANTNLLTLASVSMADDGSTFRVIVTNAAGSVTSQAATLTVRLAAPAIVAHPQSITVDERAQASFFVTARGTALHYQWQRNGEDIPGAVSESYVLLAAAMTDHEAQFRCVVSNAAGTAVSDGATLHVRQLAPVIVSEPADVTALERTAAQFSVSANGSNLTYRWQKNGEDIIGATGPTLTLDRVELADDGARFQVFVVNPAGTAASREAVLGVMLAPPSITTQPLDQAVVEGGNATFAAGVLASQATLRWKRNGQVIPGADRAEYVLSNATLADDGAQFSLEVVNAAGSVESRAASLSVELAPPVITLEPASQSVAERDPATFRVEARGSLLAYQWRRNGISIPGATLSSYTIASASLADDGATFTAVVSNAKGAITSAAATLSVALRAPVIVTEPADQVADEDGDVTFSVEVLASLASFQWYENGAPIPSATGDTLTLHDVPLSRDGSHYHVVVTNAAGSLQSRTAMLTVRQNAPVITVQPHDLTVDEGESATFAVTASGSGLTYRWQRDDADIPGATSATYQLASASLADEGVRFRCVVSNTAGSVTSTAAILHVRMVPPVITANPVDLTVVEGTSATFAVSARGSDTTYQWQRDGVAIVGATSATYELASASLADDGARFRCVVSNAAGSVTSTAALLRVNLAAPVILVQPAAATVPEGEAVSFSVAVRGSLLSYQWRRDGQDIAGATAPTYAVDHAELAWDGSVLSVVVVNAAGSVVSDGATLTVQLVPPVIIHSPVSSTVLVGTSATFECEAGGSFVTYQWQKDGVDVPGAIGPGYTIPTASLADSSTSYRCTASNAAGSVVSAAAQLTVVECFADSYASNETSCGVGACASQGQTSCANGRIQDSCAPSAPAESDASCDAVDDDCNGANDEDYQPLSTSCGVGACSATGSTSCQSGAVHNDCSPAAPAADDASCDGVDDDCGGQADEDYEPHCTATLAARCVNGGVVTEQCSDSDVCNGLETCEAGSCGAGSPLDLDDGNACTADACDPALGVSHAPLAQGTVCGSSRECDAATTCIAITPPVVTTQPEDATVPPSALASFTVSASGGNLHYQWLRFGEEIPGATASTYTTPPVGTLDHGTPFSVRVTNSAGSTVSRTATLSVEDRTPPVLSVDGENPRSVSLDFALLTGSVSDEGAGVAAVTVTSSRFPGQTSSAVLEAGGRFSVEVALSPGPNALTVHATDRAGNSAQVNVRVDALTSPIPSISITSPRPDYHTEATHVDVTGIVRSGLAPGQIRLTLGDELTFPTGTNGEYSFSFNDVPLVQGPNVITVRAETAYGTALAQTVVLRDVQAPPTTRTPPRITVTGSGPELYVPGPSAPVNGTVVAARCVDEVRVNGIPARLTGTGPSVSFDATLSFAAGSDALPITVIARDCDALTATLSYTVRRDLVAPEISVSNLELAPAINPSELTPYPVSGTITESNLAGFSANGQSVGVLPGAAGSYTFSFDVPLVRSTVKTIELEAWDFGGNRSAVSVNLALQGQLDLELVSPADGTEYLAPEGTAQVEITARAIGIAPGDRVLASLDGSASSVPLAVQGDVARGSLTVPEGEHTIAVRVESSQGAKLAAKSVRVRVKDESDIAFALRGGDPEDGATGVEPTTSPTLRFTKPVPNPTLLALKVYQTAQGRTYAPPDPGAGSTEQGTVRYRDVNLERALLTGALLVDPDGASAVFEPATHIYYGSRIEIEAFYDEEPIGKLTYQVRPPPTLLVGIAVDHLGLPIPGLSVSLRENGKSVTTYGNGVFAFGFGESVETELHDGLYHLALNPEGADPRYGTTQRLVRLEPRSLTDLGPVRVTILEPSIPYRHLESGSEVILDGGRLVLDLSEADVTFASGLREGDVHVEPLVSAYLPYAGLTPRVSPVFSYSLAPHGIHVRGTVGVSMALPTREGSHDYLESVADEVLFVGLDPERLGLTVAGVGKIDRATKRVVSEKLELGSLNLLGVQFVAPGAAETLKAYVRGEADLRRLISSLEEAN